MSCTFPKRGAEHLRLRRIAVALLLLCARSAAARSVDPGPRYNVLLVSIDSLRRDAVGCYGARPPHAASVSPSPNLDRLAAEGVRFTNAYAQSPWTLPSHLSLLTGLSPFAHGVETDLQTLDARQVTLAEILKRAGYGTIGIFSGPYLDPRWGFAKGFERYVARYGADVSAASTALEVLDGQIAAATSARDHARGDELLWQRRKAYERLQALSHDDVSSEPVTATALEALNDMARRDAPWFLFVHYFDVHYDYVPPAPWNTRFDPDYRGALTGMGFWTNPAIAVPDPNAVDGFLRRVSDRDLEHLRALYAGEVRWVDEHVGRLLARVDALGQRPRTLVVVVSDHGDEFFEHGGIGHRRTLAEEVLAIPMLLRLPGVLPAGGVVPGLVSLADVVPTVADVLGLPLETAVSGRSVLPLVRGAETADGRVILARLVRFYEGTARLDGADVPARLATVQEAFRSGPIKIVRRRQWQTYPAALDASRRAMLQASADEQFRHEELAWIDVASYPTEPAEALRTDFHEPRARAALEAFRKRYRELRVVRGAPSISPEDARLRAELQSLGYVDAVESGHAPVSPRDDFALPPPRDRRAPAPQ